MMNYSTISPVQLILAAFCYVEAAMVWKIGDVLVYCGQVPSWFVWLIAGCLATAGFVFQFEGVLYKRHPIYGGVP